MNAYTVLKDKQQKEVNEFPMFFAFSNEQFNEGMAKFGLKPEDTDKIYSLSGTGGFYKRTDSEKLKEMMNRHEKERQEAIEGDETGDGYIFDMFNYELGNHEFVITYDVEDTLDALCLTIDEVNASEKLKHGLNKAIKSQKEWYENN